MWPHRQLCPLILVKYIDQQKAKNPQQQTRASVKRDIPPPPAIIIAVYFPQKQGRKNKDDGQDLKFSWNMNPEFTTEHNGQEGDNADSEQQKCMNPMPLIYNRNELHCHHPMEKDHQVTVKKFCLAAPCRSRLEIGVTGHEDR